MRAASTRPAEPTTATVRGTSIPAARSAVSCATLLTSSSSTERPLTVRRPAASTHERTERVWSLDSPCPRVWLDAEKRDQNTPGGGGSSRSSTPPVSSHSTYGTPSASSASANGPNQSGFSWMA